MEDRRALVFLAALLVGIGTGVDAQEQGVGRQLFEAHYGSCHGARAGGDGWLSRFLTRTPPALNTLSRHYGGKFPAEIVRSVIDGRRQVAMHGPRDMPVWGDVFSVGYDRSTVRPANDVSPHFPPPQTAEVRVQQNIQALLDYLEQIQR